MEVLQERTGYSKEQKGDSKENEETQIWQEPMIAILAEGASIDFLLGHMEWSILECRRLRTEERGVVRKRTKYRETRAGDRNLWTHQEKVMNF